MGSQVKTAQRTSLTTKIDSLRHLTIFVMCVICFVGGVILGYSAAPDADARTEKTLDTIILNRLNQMLENR